MPERLLTSRQVRQHYGGCSDMTLWRWLRHETLQFPRPVIINGRRYWREDEIAAFDKRQSDKPEVA
jgi:predicted DNA-binding transcriptional regulator AlpA